MSFAHAQTKVADKLQKRIGNSIFRTNRDRVKQETFTIGKLNSTMPHPHLNNDNNPQQGRYLGDVPVHAATLKNESSSAGSTLAVCTLRTAPLACPFGGACHACPVRAQPKLAVSQSGDVYEQEADTVAKQIGQTPYLPQSNRELSPKKHLDTHSQEVVDNTNEEVKSKIDDGQPLSKSDRNFFELQFGYDLGQVRIHTNSRAANSVRRLNALSYAVGQNLFFGCGRYVPETMKGRQLLAHELTHVIQQSGDGNVPQLQRQTNLLTVQPQSIQPPNLVRTQRLEQILVQIDEETRRSVELRAGVESQPPISSEVRSSTESNLNDSRENLTRLLEERIWLLKEEINSLNLRIGPNPTSSPLHPELSELGYELGNRQRELRQHELQLQALTRWRTRQSIHEIQGRIEEVNRETLALPPLNPAEPTSDMADPRAQELMKRRANLERQQTQRAKLLTSTTTPFKQADPRWGNRRYGTSTSCTNLAGAGCGPTSLAILLNYLFQEDPEAATVTNTLEFVTPPIAATYAATHGRICNKGTVGDTMVTNVATQWPGFRGLKITLEQAVGHLRAGNLIIFLCKSCTGQNMAGQNKSYGGHYMVLNGVNENATQFDVIDPAGHNIANIARSELVAHTKGFWTVVKK